LGVLASSTALGQDADQVALEAYATLQERWAAP